MFGKQMYRDKQVISCVVHFTSSTSPRPQETDSRQLQVMGPMLIVVCKYREEQLEIC